MVATYSHEHRGDDQAVAQVVSASLFSGKNQESCHQENHADETSYVQGLCHSVPCFELWEQVSRGHADMEVCCAHLEGTSNLSLDMVSSRQDLS